MLLSVIIPAYNAEKYIIATVESVLKQNCGDFEVILVDDGSVDGTANLCDALAEEYEQVKVIHKANGGVSSARNAGIDVAQGKYLAFVDADDKVAENMFDDLLAECENKNADKAFCGFVEVYEDANRIKRIADIPARQLLNRDFIVDKMLLMGCRSASYMNSVCGGIFKADIIREHNLRFEDRPMGEDWLFNMQYCDIIQSVVYIDQPYYVYMRNGDSAMSRYQPRQFELWLENRKFKNRLSNKYHYDIDESERDAQWITRVMLYALAIIEHEERYIVKLTNIFTNEEFKKALKNAKTINSRFFIPVVWLLKINCLMGAIALLRIYSLRIK